VWCANSGSPHHLWCTPNQRRCKRVDAVNIYTPQVNYILYRFIISTILLCFCYRLHRILWPQRGLGLHVKICFRHELKSDVSKLVEIRRCCTEIVSFGFDNNQKVVDVWLPSLHGAFMLLQAGFNPWVDNKLMYSSPTVNHHSLLEYMARFNPMGLSYDCQVTIRPSKYKRKRNSYFYKSCHTNKRKLQK